MFRPGLSRSRSPRSAAGTPRKVTWDMLRKCLEGLRFPPWPPRLTPWHGDWPSRLTSSRFSGSSTELIQDPRAASSALFLSRCAGRLAGRVEALEVRLGQGDETAWPEYVEVVKALILVVSRRHLPRTGWMARLFARDSPLAQDACAWMCRHRGLAAWLGVLMYPRLPV